MLLGRGFVFLALIRLVTCLFLSLHSAGIPEREKIWTIIQYLFRSDKRAMLADMYPVVMQLDEDFETLDSLNLCDAISRHFSEMGERDLASLMPLYCRLYPMGLLTPKKYNYSQGEAYFLLNGKRYDNPDDVFYLESGELRKQAEKEDKFIIEVSELIIGDNVDAPVIYFYGCPDDSEGKFDEFNRNLYSEAAQTGKLRFIWRSTCDLRRDAHGDAKIGPFPVEFTIREEGSDIDALPTDSLEIPNQFKKSKYGRIKHPKVNQLNDLDLKVAYLIARKYDSTKDFNSTMNYARGIINNFPLLVLELAATRDNTEGIAASTANLTESGIGSGLLGLYINGANLKLSSLDEYSLLNAIELEYHRLNQLLSGLRKISPKSTLVTAKDLIGRFSQISIPTLQQSQPIKIDLHRIRGFSESVIYFNDIEIDDQYRDLTKNIEKFFEKSKFGEIPEYRHNWSELIFVIDFNNLEDQNVKLALDGLRRAIAVITQGYPQRIGLLPLNTGCSDNIIKKIYELRDRDLLELEDFLNNDLLKGDQIFSHYINVPDVAKLLRTLQINETSIIINGEIYPFKKNSWHYLIAKTIKKDMGFLKRELKKYIKRDGEIMESVINVRDVLHLKSSEGRNVKYTPDYYADSTYSTLENAVLSVWSNRILEYVKGKEYNTLHTATLVDDFNTLQALKRLHNLVQVKFLGIKLRIIHSGALGSTWKSLKKIVSMPSFPLELKSLIKRSVRGIATSELDPKVLERWLPDLDPQFVRCKSFILINGRFIHFEENEIPHVKLFEITIKREAQRTMDALEALEIVFPGFVSGKIDPEFMETTSAILTKMFYQGTELYGNGPLFTTETTLSRFDMNGILQVNNFTIFQSINSERKPIDLLLVIDPLEERSQKILSLIADFQLLPFVNIKIVLYPTKDISFMPIERIYVPNFPDHLGGKLREIGSEFDVEIDAPTNFVLNDYTKVCGYLIEIHAFDERRPVSQGEIDGLGDVCLEISDINGTVIDQTITMTTFGYGQFILPYLGSNFIITSCDPRYRVTSFASDARADYIPVESINVTNLNPVTVYVKLEKIDNAAKIDMEENAINIFTVPRHDDLFEQEYEQMVLQILYNPRNNQMSSTNFWLLDQPFISHSFRRFIEAINLDSNLNCTIALVNYVWPLWLRPQRFFKRRMDAYKVLFLDLLFPQSVSRLIYMDPSMSQLPDPFKLSTMKTKLPFAMYKMVGHGYWENAYWANRLHDRNLKFHSVSPAFLVNLNKLRLSDGGNKLRIHYQRLSADVFSLAKLDQDLINDVQEDVPIRTLSSSTIVFLDLDEPDVQNSLTTWLKNFKASLADEQRINSIDSAGERGVKEQGNTEGQDLFHDEL